MEGGGVYIRWAGRLWQEQPDGTFLVWNEQAHRWEASIAQPPVEPGESRETKECPNCGKRVKATLRHCPYCEFGFEERVSATQTAPLPTKPRAGRTGPSPILVGALLFLLLAAGGGGYLFQRNRTCENWRSAVAEITQARVDQGLPEGMTEEEVYTFNEALLSEKRPGGCE